MAVKHLTQVAHSALNSDGSNSTILLNPNDQYLCIVPDSRARANATPDYLPFEGDNVLSIILSKALLLTADDKITDPTITRQLSLS